MEDLLNKCPSCESDKIFYNIESTKGIMEYDDNKLIAFKLIEESEFKSDISCLDCGTEIVATMQGLRIK